MLALIAGLAWLPLGQLLAGIIWPLPAYTIRAAEALAQLPNGSLVTGPASQALVILYYILLFALAAGLFRPGWFRRWLAPGVALVLAALLAVGVWRSALAAPDGKLHLTMLGLEGGPALLLRTPDGQATLLNGAADARALEDDLARRLPPFGARLDALLITTRYASPLNALASLVERFPPAQVGLAQPRGTARDRLVSTLKAQGAQVIKLETGHQLDLGQGARLRVLAETKDGVALLVEWGNFRALLPGGVAPAEPGAAGPGPDPQPPACCCSPPPTWRRRPPKNGRNSTRPGGLVSVRAG